MNRDRLKYLRHELRTLLNHILGYAEILKEDVREAGKETFLSDIEQVYRETDNIHNLFISSFYDEGHARDEFDPASFKKALFGPLYIVIGLAQRLKKRCEDEKAGEFAPDVERILEAARKLLDLVEQEIRNLELEEAGDIPLPTLYAQQQPLPVAPREEGHLLVVDDNEMNRDILVRHLERQGHHVLAVDNGYQALQVLKQRSFDLVLLDILMPGINGYQVLDKLKQDPDLRHIPVIMISALDEMDSVAHCIAMGAEDYLPKTFDPLLLKARISACLGKKRFRDQEQRYLAALLESRSNLEKELADAAEYVKGLLPKPLSAPGPVLADWIFAPSAKLGGDCFDYHWLDEQHLALYLLDVSGHGIGAALLSVSVMNVLRTQGLPHVDFTKPAEVLGALNQTFQMEQQNNMYFTIWYGVYEPSGRRLTYGSAGAPPCLLVRAGAEGPVTEELTTTDMIIGADTDYEYETRQETLPGDSRLYLFSDGAYEVKKSSGKMLNFKEFSEILAAQPAGHQSHVQAIHSQIQGLTGLDHFEDDFSLLELIIP